MKKVGFFRSIQFKFVVIYTLLILLAMQVIGVYFADRMEETSMDSIRTTLTNNAQTLAYSMGESIDEGKNSSKSPYEIRQKITEQLQGADINSSAIYKEALVVDKQGIIIAATDPDIIGKKTQNQIILRNLVSSEGGKAAKTVKDSKSGERSEVVTAPIMSDNEQYGLIYIRRSLSDVYKELTSVNRILGTATGIALLLTAVLGFFLARTITKPLAQMRKQAASVAQGDFSGVVRYYDDDEIGDLAVAFNNMTNNLHEANELTESERRKLQSVLTYMTDGVIATDKNGKVMLMNNRAEELLNVRRRLVMGASIVDLLMMPEEYTLDTLYTSEESIILDHSTDHNELLLRVNFSVIKKEHQLKNGLIAVLHDVTEQEQLETERREFVANVSHELRTPLTTMKSYLEALSEGAVEQPALAAKFLDVTQNETERMIRLVNDLLQLSKMDSADFNFEKGQIDYIKLCNLIVDRFELGKRQNIKIVRDFPDTGVNVYIDKDKIIQVVDNILSNAIKYSPEGGVITARLTLKDGEVTTSVEDQGVGIPQESLSKVFTRFYRVDRHRSRKLGGTGLGLAIAKEIIEAHDGHIWAESEWQKGTKISFTLPLYKGESDS